MADFDKLESAVHSVAEGLEQAVSDCIGANRFLISDLVREQLYSGLDGNTDSLRPSYSDDPFFDREGPWYHNPDGYIEWKRKLTPPVTSPKLNLPPRPVDVPNLIITGAFHESIVSLVSGDMLSIKTEGFIDGPDIVRKYGDDILNLGKDAREYVVIELLEPFISDFFRKYGF